MPTIKKPTIREYIDICSKNAKNKKPYEIIWDENNISNELAYFFQDENIFKEFLKSVLDYNKDNQRFESDDVEIDNLQFKKMRFPKVRVPIKIDNKKKEIDILFEGENFICIIENKLRSKEHDEQCEFYKTYVKTRCENENKTPICIYLDSELSSQKIDKEKFNIEGYYLAWYGENVLPVLENCNHEILGNDIKNFCNFLKELVWSSLPEIKKEKNSRRTRIKGILKDIGYDSKIKYDEIVISESNKEYIIERFDYLELSLENDDKKIKEELKKRLETAGLKQVGWAK